MKILFSKITEFLKENPKHIMYQDLLELKDRFLTSDLESSKQRGSRIKWHILSCVFPEMDKKQFKEECLLWTSLWSSSKNEIRDALTKIHNPDYEESQIYLRNYVQLPQPGKGIF